VDLDPALVSGDPTRIPKSALVLPAARDGARTEGPGGDRSADAVHVGDQHRGVPTSDGSVDRLHGLQRLGRSAWSLVGIATVVVGCGWLVWRLRVVAFPLFIAVLLAAVLAPLVRWLVRRGIGPTAAATLVVVGFLAMLVGIGLLIVPAIVEQVSELGTQVGEAVDKLERWVARERPFGFDAVDIQRLRSNVAGASPDPQQLADGARTTGGILAGMLFTVIATFFFLRDGRSMVEGIVRLMPADWREDAWSIARSIVSSLAGYARGAAVLGALEGAVIGITVAAVGGDLPAVLGILTLLAAFVPFVGAIVAAALAIGVTLVTAGTTPALIVAAVSLVVQQLDNDFLAPVIYGRFLQIHPLAVLASISVGIETAGLIGAFVAVPVAASAVSIWRVIAMRRLRATFGLDEHGHLRERITLLGRRR
jgi:putative heme transporter